MTALLGPLVAAAVVWATLFRFRFLMAAAAMVVVFVWWEVLVSGFLPSMTFITRA